MILSAIGASVDILHAYADQQKLVEVTALACQYATRPSVILTASGSYAGIGSLASYKDNVTSFVTTTLQRQFPANSPSYSQTPAYTGTPGAAFTISLTSSVPTALMKIAGVSTIPIHATATCSGSSAPQQVNNNNVLLHETFASSSLASGGVFLLPSGAVYSWGSGAIPLQSTFPSSPAYTGANGAQWYVMGYCMESDSLGAVNAQAPGGGQRGVELDCDNGSGTAGNSSISTQVYMAAGNYELRWYYTGRIGYPNYDPAYICGSSAADVSWANDLQTGHYTGGLSGTSVFAGSPVGASALRTNQINVYLDQPLASGKPPTHTTLDGAETLAGSNLVDVCVYAPSNGTGNNNKSVWIQRSVRI